MAQERVPNSGVERRCPNCGARVAREAESCIMCGHDLRIQPKRRRRISWIDALLVTAVIAVLAVWWQIGNQPVTDTVTEEPVAVIPPTVIPVFQATATEPPTPTPTPVPTAVPQPVVVTRDITHTVQSGETLLSIALTYDVTVGEIQQANNLSDVLIRIGQALRIPVKEQVEQPNAAAGPTSTFRYTVQQGDTIISIASRFGSTVEDILDANNLAANAIIRPGDELLIPIRQVPQEVLASPAQAPTQPPAAPANAPAATPGQTTYARPQLTSPADGATLARNEPVLLRWVSVDLLAPNEWYVLLVYPQSANAQTLPSIWTKTTTHRMETDLAPAEGESADYAWQVSVVRVLDGPQGGYVLEAVSPPSELRRFTWK